MELSSDIWNKEDSTPAQEARCAARRGRNTTCARDDRSPEGGGRETLRPILPSRDTRGRPGPCGRRDGCRRRGSTILHGHRPGDRALPNDDAPLDLLVGGPRVPLPRRRARLRARPAAVGPRDHGDARAPAPRARASGPRATRARHRGERPAVRARRRSTHLRRRRRLRPRAPDDRRRGLGAPAQPGVGGEGLPRVGPAHRARRRGPARATTRDDQATWLGRQLRRASARRGVGERARVRPGKRAPGGDLGLGPGEPDRPRSEPRTTRRPSSRRLGRWSRHWAGERADPDEAGADVGPLVYQA